MIRKIEFALGVAGLFMLGWGAASAGSVTPESVKALFDAWGVYMLFALGAVIKYVPWFASVRNYVIGWLNVVVYILGRLVLPGEVHAGVLEGVPAALGVVLGGITNSSVAMVLYETLGRTLLERWLHLKKVPHPKGT